MEIKLSDEQQEFINYALSGKNVLVDACIGSGKTTAIQCLCNKIKENFIETETSIIKINLDHIAIYPYKSILLKIDM